VPANPAHFERDLLRQVRTSCGANRRTPPADGTYGICGCPADELDEFCEHIVGPIEVVEVDTNQRLAVLAVAHEIRPTITTNCADADQMDLKRTIVIESQPSRASRGIAERISDVAPILTAVSTLDHIHITKRARLQPLRLARRAAA
jgi:hypothetical protein